MKSLLSATEELHFISTEFDAEFTRMNNRKSLTHPFVLKERTFGKSLAFQDSNRPEVAYYNRVIGFNEKDLSELDNIIDWYLSKNLKCRISLLPEHQSKELLATLDRKGFEHKSTDPLYYLNLENVNPKQLGDIRIELVSESVVGELFSLLRTSGINIDPVIVDDLKHYYVAPYFNFYLAYINDQPVALASLYVYQEYGVLSNAYTREEYRGLGCQSQLLQARINKAKKLGCKALITDTELNSVSHRNILRSGFQIAYSTTELEL